MLKFIPIYLSLIVLI